MSSGWSWAVAAGATASGAAVVAKLASLNMNLEYRMILYAAVVCCNVIMWSCYMRSLQTLSSLQATVANFAANFLLSGLAGGLIFGEALHFQWFLGACSMLLGIWVLSCSSTEDDQKTA